jgi:hypothetical protein
VQDPDGFKALEFRTSSFSGGGACVEVGRRLDGQVVLRDSKDPLRRIALTLDPNSWALLVTAIKSGAFDA